MVGLMLYIDSNYPILSIEVLAQHFENLDLPMSYLVIFKLLKFRQSLRMELSRIWNDTTTKAWILFNVCLTSDLSGPDELLSTIWETKQRESNICYHAWLTIGLVGLGGHSGQSLVMTLERILQLKCKVFNIRIKICYG